MPSAKSVNVFLRNLRLRAFNFPMRETRRKPAKLPLEIPSMNYLEAVRLALQSLWANKLRSVLTLLGVVIGVAAVIAVVTFVNGINGYVAEKIFGLGADVFKVSKMPSVITSAEVFLETQKRKNFDMEDYQAVLEN